MSFWKQHELDVPLLEKFLLDNLESHKLSNALCTFMEQAAARSQQSLLSMHPASPAPSPRLGLLLPFSTSFYLSLINSFLNDSDKPGSGSGVGMVAGSNSSSGVQPTISRTELQQRMWSSIRENLNKDLRKREKIVIPNVSSLSSAVDGTANSPEVCMTCHAFTPLCRTPYAVNSGLFNVHPSSSLSSLGYRGLYVWTLFH